MIKRWSAVLAEWDKQVSAWVATPASHQRHWSYWLALIGAHLGDTWLWGLVIVWEWQRARSSNNPKIAKALPTDAEPVHQPTQPSGPERTRLIRSWFLALLAALGINLLIKQLAKRTRPGVGTLLYGAGPDEYSFPSGHAMRMGVIVTWANTLWPGRSSLIYLLALWVCWSRVRLGIHYIGDVLVGCGLGGLIGRLTR